MKKIFAPGFRLSVPDIGIIVTALTAAVFLYAKSPLLSFIILFVVTHFFVFCNLIRMSRLLELIWAGAFLILLTAAIQFQLLSLKTAFSISLLLTCMLVYQELKKPGYHGILWQKANPKLKQWFEANKLD